MSNFVDKDFCREKHEELTKEFNRFEVKITNRMTRLETDLTNKMDNLKGHFNDELDNNIEEKKLRAKILLAIIGAAGGALASFLPQLLNYILH